MSIITMTPDIQCFGKVTGLDVVNETYILSIGTNQI